MARECSIVDSIMTYLNGLPYCVAEKVVGNSNQKGRADINACYRGRNLRIEVKTSDNGNKASEIQKLNLMKWKNAGAVTVVAYDKEQVVDAIQKLDKESFYARIEKWFSIVKDDLEYGDAVALGSILGEWEDKNACN